MLGYANSKSWIQAWIVAEMSVWASTGTASLRWGSGPVFLCSHHWCQPGLRGQFLSWGGKGWDQDRQGLLYHCPHWQHRPCALTLTPAATNPHMAFGCSLGWTSPWPGMAWQVTQISLVLVSAWPSDINVASGNGSVHRHSYGLWWQHDHGHQPLLL